MSFLRNLQVQVLLAALIPGSAILIIVAIIALFQYGATVLNIVEQRDTKLARLTAHQLSDALARQTRVLEKVSGNPDSRMLDAVAARLSQALERGSLESFDGGVILYDFGWKSYLVEPRNGHFRTCPLPYTRHDPGIPHSHIFEHFH